MTEHPSQMSQFITYLQQQCGAEHGAVGDAQTLALDRGEMATFLAHVASLERGRAEREADEEYQADLRACLDLLPGPRPQRRERGEGAA